MPVQLILLPWWMWCMAMFSPTMSVSLWPSGVIVPDSFLPFQRCLMSAFVKWHPSGWSSGQHSCLLQ